MRKFGGLLNKLTGSGKFDAEALRQDAGGESSEEELNEGFDMPVDEEHEQVEEIKFKKSFSLRALSPFKPQESKESTEFDEGDFSKKKSNSMRNMPGKLQQQENDRDKLNDSDDKAIRKSFSLRGGMSLFKSSDQLKTSEAPRSPSAIKAFFSPQHDQHHSLSQYPDEHSDESEEDDSAQSVPKKSRRVPVHSNVDDFDLPSPYPIAHVPPSPSSRTYTSGLRNPSSPASASPIPSRIPPSSPVVRIPYNPASTSPVPFPPSPAHSPETQAAQVPTSRTPPALVSVDEFDAQFGRMRADSITDDYGEGYGRDRAESAANDDGTLIESGGSNTFGRFSFNKSSSKKK